MSFILICLFSMPLNSVWTLTWILCSLLNLSLSLCVWFEETTLTHTYSERTFYILRTYTESSEWFSNFNSLCQYELYMQNMQSYIKQSLTFISMCFSCLNQYLHTISNILFDIEFLPHVYSRLYKRNVHGKRFFRIMTSSAECRGAVVNLQIL